MFNFRNWKWLYHISHDIVIDLLMRADGEQSIVNNSINIECMNGLVIRIVFFVFFSKIDKIFIIDSVFTMFSIIWWTDERPTNKQQQKTEKKTVLMIFYGYCGII